jgi:hypothetical protein
MGGGGGSTARALGLSMSLYVSLYPWTDFGYSIIECK